MNSTEFDALMKDLNMPKTKPSWMKKSPARNAYCAHCHSQYAKSELNADKHCRHCADELGEAHPINR
jgi:hypothetical protein